MRTYVNPIEQAFNTLSSLTLADYNELLSGFDWFYDFSDDHGVWTRGNRNRGVLKTIASKKGPEFEFLFEAWRKHYFSGKAWGTPDNPRPPLKDIDVWVKLMMKNPA